MNDIRGKVSAEAIPGIPRTKEEILSGIMKDIWGTTFEDLSKKNRKREMVLPRQLCMAMLNIHGYSNTKAAQPFNKDHATTIHSRKVISNIVDTKYPKDDYDRVTRTLQRYKEHFSDFDLSELHRTRDYNYNGK